MRHVEFLSPELGDELWEVFARYRAAEPVLWEPRTRMYCVFRYDAIRACLSGADFTVDYPFRVSRQVFGRTLLDMDGPEHVRLRKRLGGLLSGKDGNPSFTTPVDRCAAQVLDRLAAAREFDFVDAVARRLPEAVTAAFLGIPAPDRESVFADLRYLLEHLDGSSRDFSVTARLRERVSELIGTLLREPLSEPETVIEHLGRAVRAGELDEPDARGLALLVLAAGVETSTGLLANTMVALARHPRWWEPDNADPETLLAVVREVVRWEPPQMDTVRFARRDTELGGVPIPRGGALKLLLGSGNRDEAVFEHPDEFRPDRPARPALGFGYGPHSCLGMHMALTVAARFFAAFIRRFPRAAVLGATPAVGGWTFRRPATLPMAIDVRIPAER